MRLVLAMLLRHASSVAVRNALQNAVAALHKAKVPEAQASAEWLLAHALGESDRTSVQRAVATKRDLDSKQQAQFSAFVERRLQREPVQYIVGKWAFHDIELELAPPTLIPRSGRGVQTLRFVRRGDGVEACKRAVYAITATGRRDSVEGLESAACAIEVSASTERRRRFAAAGPRPRSWWISCWAGGVRLQRLLLMSVAAAGASASLY